MTSHRPDQRQLSPVEPGMGDRPGRIQQQTTQYELLVNLIDRLDAESFHQQFGQFEEFFSVLLEESGLYIWGWDLESDDIQRYPPTEQLFGVPKEGLEPFFDGFCRYVHPEYRSNVETTIRNAIEDGSSYQTEYILELPDNGSIWVDEYARVLTDDTGTASHVIGFASDITEQKEYQRELEWERKLNMTLREAFVDSRTRSDIESTIVQQLYEYGYTLVWLGDWLADELKPRAVVGKETQIDALGLRTGIDRRESIPSIMAATKIEPIFVSDFTDNSQPEWYHTAHRCGVRAAAALPLVYSDVFYGVLSVYDDEQGSFDDATKRHLTTLADTLAVVIHNIENQHVLAANRNIKSKLHLVGTEYYLRELIDQADCNTQQTRITVHETLPHDGGQTIQYISVDGASAERIVDAAVADDRIDDATMISNGTESRVQLIHDEETPEATLTTLGTRVCSTSVTANRADILIETPTKSALKAAIEALGRSSDHVSVLSCTEIDNPESESHGLLSELTEKQFAALQAAFHQGYFETPREASAKDVAGSLGISHPTFLEHLRLAQQKIFSTQLTDS